MADLLRQKFMHFFRMSDRNHDGRITRQDYVMRGDVLVDILGLESASAPAKQIRDGLLNMWNSLAKSADKNDDGSVDVEEWVAHWKAIAGNDEMVHQVMGAYVRNVIDLFDRDRDGKLSREDWDLFFQGSGLPAKQHEIAFDKLDLNGDGYLDNDELYEAALQFFQSENPDSAGNWLFGDYASSK